jgi:hypothetical protein
MRINSNGIEYDTATATLVRQLQLGRCTNGDVVFHGLYCTRDNRYFSYQYQGPARLLADLIRRGAPYANTQTLTPIHDARVDAWLDSTAETARAA